jgi:SRSO17 transposase
LLYGKDEQGMPGNPYHLLVGRNVLKPDEIKFFISNAPPETKVETLLLVGFSRWRVERCFQDQKSELGLDAYEGRRYPGLKRHLVLTSVSHLFLARVHHELREKKSGVNGLPGPHRRRRARAIMVA